MQVGPFCVYEYALYAGNCSNPSNPLILPVSESTSPKVSHIPFEENGAYYLLSDYGTFLLPEANWF